jgi:adenylate kinase
MIIALTGTPGTGKTTIALLLQSKYNIKTLNLHNFAKENNLIIGYDNQRNSDMIDIASVEKKINEIIRNESLIVLDGHLSHLISCVTNVIVLRCHPKILQKRLQQKNWQKNKINENIEAEMLDIILTEAVDFHSIDHVIEIDTTNKNNEKTTEIIHKLITSSFKKKTLYKPGSIDWTELLLSEEFQWRDQL